MRLNTGIIRASAATALSELQIIMIDLRHAKSVEGYSGFLHSDIDSKMARVNKALFIAERLKEAVEKLNG